MIFFETIQNCIQTDLHQQFWLKELLTLRTTLVNSISIVSQQFPCKQKYTKMSHYKDVAWVSLPQRPILASCMLPDKIEHAVLAEAMSTVALKWILQQQSTLPTLVLCIHTITKYGNWVACRCCCHPYSLQFYRCRKLSAVVVLKPTTHHVSKL